MQDVIDGESDGREVCAGAQGRGKIHLRDATRSAMLHRDRASPVPKPTKLPETALLSKDTQPEEAVDEFLSKFGADMEDETTFRDAADTGIATLPRRYFRMAKGSSGGLHTLRMPKSSYEPTDRCPHRAR